MQKYLPFFRSIFLKKRAYKASFYIELISSIFQVVATVYIWKAVYGDSNNVIQGYTLKEMVIYLILSSVLIKTLNSGTDAVLSSDVDSGDLSIYLTKPVSYVSRVIWEAFGNICYQVIYLFLPCIVLIFISGIFSGGNINLNNLNMLFFFISIVMSAILVFLINFSIGLLSFNVNYIWGFLVMKDAILKFLSGELFPLSFLPKNIQNIIKLSPFQNIVYGPISILLDKVDRKDIIFMYSLQVSWIVIGAVICKIMWERSQKRITINGG